MNWPVKSPEKQPDVRRWPLAVALAVFVAWALYLAAVAVLHRMSP
jgi:hypothetical protein